MLERATGLHYKRGMTKELELIGYNDSDLGGDIDDHKSTSGILFFLGINPITWHSSKQKVAEYIASAPARRSILRPHMLPARQFGLLGC